MSKIAHENDEFGSRMKTYEAQETERYFLPLLPIYARLDGRSFHTFTKGMERPFDARFSATMEGVVRFLVEETHAVVGYTQSDEISLCWIVPDYKSEAFFNRRIFKLTSVLSGLASAKFNQSAMVHWPEKVVKQVPCFDCRVYTLPNEVELMNCFLWREQDAVKNSITMAASAYYSHKELHLKNGKQKQEMLFAKGINFNDYPDYFKRGIYVRRETQEEELDEATRMKIPEAKRPAIGTKFTRSSIGAMHVPPLSRIENKCDVLFRGMKPILKADERAKGSEHVCVCCGKPGVRNKDGTWYCEHTDCAPF